MACCCCSSSSFLFFLDKFFSIFVGISFTKVCLLTLTVNSDSCAFSFCFDFLSAQISWDTNFFCGQIFSDLVNLLLHDCVHCFFNCFFCIHTLFFKLITHLLWHIIAKLFLDVFNHFFSHFFHHWDHFCKVGGSTCRFLSIHIFAGS